MRSWTTMIASFPRNARISSKRHGKVVWLRISLSPWRSIWVQDTPHDPAASFGHTVESLSGYRGKLTTFCRPDCRPVRPLEGRGRPRLCGCWCVGGWHASDTALWPRAIQSRLSAGPARCIVPSEGLCVLSEHARQTVTHGRSPRWATFLKCRRET